MILTAAMVMMALEDPKGRSILRARSLCVDATIFHKRIVSRDSLCHQHPPPQAQNNAYDNEHPIQANCHGRN